MILSDLIDQKSSQLGVQPDILKTAIGLALVILLSPIYRFLKNPLLRKLITIIMGSLLLFFILEGQAFFVLSSILIPYLLIRALPQPFLTSVVCSFVLLVLVHAHRYIFSYSVWKVDSSVYIMLLVTKLTYYAKWYTAQTDKSNARLLDYLEYQLFFPTLMVGPTFSYQLYQTFSANCASKGSRPLNLPALLQPLIFALPIAALSITLMPSFPSTWVLSNPFYLELPLWQKSLILVPVGFIYRSKYYAAWYIGQTCANLSTLSQKQNGDYNAVSTVSIKFQTEPNPKLKTEYWNTSAQEWLKLVVYDSLAPKMGSTTALFATFAISAFWHGLYLTYYLGFALWAMLQQVTKWFYKWSQLLPRSITNSVLYSILAWIASSLMMAHIGMFMLLLEWSKAVEFYQGLYYLPVLLLFGLTGLSLLVKPPRGSKEGPKSE